MTIISIEQNWEDCEHLAQCEQSGNGRPVIARNDTNVKVSELEDIVLGLLG